MNETTRDAVATTPSLSWSAARPLHAAGREERSLSTPVRLRAALLGLGLGVLALVAAAVLALVIVAGPFHTSLGAIA